jgi:hypothetical protein
MIVKNVKNWKGGQTSLEVFGLTSEDLHEFQDFALSL